MGAWTMVHPTPMVLRLDFPDQSFARSPLSRWIFSLLVLTWIVALIFFASVSVEALVLLLVAPATVAVVIGVLEMISGMPVRSLTMDSQRRRMVLDYGPEATTRNISYKEIRGIEYQTTQWGRSTRTACIIVRLKTSPNIVLYQVGIKKEHVLHAWLKIMFERRCQDS